MIAKSYIQANLRALDKKYRESISQKDSLFYSKLAILELCGWIEESMDDIVLRCAKRHVRGKKNRDYFLSQIVRRTHGFDYQAHFRRMLIHLIGIINVERIERAIDANTRAQFEAALRNLKRMRDPEAHTHIKGVTRSIDAPSITMSQFPVLYAGLVAFQDSIKRARI